MIAQVRSSTRLNTADSTSEEILSEFQKISRLGKKKCFYCNNSLEKWSFTFKDKGGLVFSCEICIIRLALTHITRKTNTMKEEDLAQILDLVTTSYVEASK